MVLLDILPNQLKQLLTDFLIVFVSHVMTLGHTLPFLPLPFGIVACANLLTFGVIFDFLNFSIYSGSCLDISATATEWAHIHIPFQLGHSESQAKMLLCFGTTRCGLLPL